MKMNEHFNMNSKNIETRLEVKNESDKSQAVSLWNNKAIILLGR